MISRGCSLKKILVQTPQKNPKNPKKIQKIQEFFKGFKIYTTYLEMYNPSISLFKYFFIHKILVHPKNSGQKSKKIQKKNKIKKK